MSETTSHSMKIDMTLANFM